MFSLYDIIVFIKYNEVCRHNIFIDQKTFKRNNNFDASFKQINKSRLFTSTIINNNLTINE